MSASDLERPELRTIVYRSTGTPEERRRRARRIGHLENFVAIATPILLIALWESLARAGAINAQIYPPPTAIAEAGAALLEDGRLQAELGSTLSRVLLGYGGGVVSGYVLGVIMGSFHFVRRALEPTLSAIYVIPKIALLPVFLTIFGFGDAPLIAIVAVTVFFYVWIDTMESVASVPRGYHEAAQSLGVNGWQVFRHVLFPATLPKFFVVLRLTMGLGVLVIVAAEFVVGQDGLGHLIFHSRELFLLDRTYLGIVVVAVVGVTLQGLVSLLGKWAVPWAEQGRR